MAAFTYRGFSYVSIRIADVARFTKNGWRDLGQREENTNMMLKDSWRKRDWYILYIGINSQETDTLICQEYCRENTWEAKESTLTLCFKSEFLSIK